MQGYFAIAALLFLILLVLFRSHQMKKFGIKVFHFGEINKTDFLIPPFVLLFFYLIIANTLDLPRFGGLITENQVVAWIGVVLCALALCMFAWGIVSFGESFRVGVDEDRPNSLVSTGAFSISRNPLYLAFFMVLFGVFLIFPTWIFLTYFVAGLWLIDRQVCIEENSLRKIYGKEYDDYCNRVRRYI